MLVTTFTKLLALLLFLNWQVLEPQSISAYISIRFRPSQLLLELDCTDSFLYTGYTAEVPGPET